MAAHETATRRSRHARWLAPMLVAAACGAVFAACGHARGPARAPRESLLDDSRFRSTFQSPAVWRYHPRAEAPLLARQELSDGTILYAGERGERWLYDKKKKTVRAGARLAPESLIAILHLDDGGWLFVGKSGTGYESREPLGPFVRTSAPVDKLARVSAAGTSVVGVTRDGQLVQSADAGASWNPVGAAKQRYVDVVLSDPKHGLALSVPEAVWQTDDGGASWKKTDAETVGALGLAWDDRQGVAVRTATGWMRWDPKTPRSFAPLGRSPSQARFRLMARPERGPDASAIEEGRAIVLDGTYWELARESLSGAERWRSGMEQRWRLYKGPVDGKLTSRSFEAATGCANVRLAGFGQYVALACLRSSSGSNQRVTFQRSEDGGKTFEAETFTAEGRSSGLAIAIGGDGALIVTGVCPPHNASRGCLPYGVYRRRRAPVDAGTDSVSAADTEAGGAKSDGGAEVERFELAPSATPAMKGSALALTFSPDGRTAYAVGRRTKGNSLVVYVSHDAGASFEPHEVEQADQLEYDDENTDDRWSRPPPTPSSKVTSVAAAEDGTLSIVLGGAGAPSLVVVDEEGRVVSLSRAPGEATSLGAIGTRALAFSESANIAWESLDGGATWDPIGKLPSGTCKSDGSGCNPAVACHPAGCVIGAELSRVGWHGQADDEQGVLAPPDRGYGDLFDRKVRTSLACSLDEKPWQALAGVSNAPTAERAAIGKVAWYLLVHDDGQASVTTYHAFGGSHVRVDKVALLAPVRNASSVAYTSTLQVEGSAALRYPAPESGAPSIRNAEVVWDNLLEGKLTRQRIADLGPVQVGDFVRSGIGAQRAQPNLLSIATGGLYLRIHSAARDGQPTMFLDGRGTTTVPSITWPTATLGARTEMAHVGGSHVPLMFVGPGSAVVRARQNGGAWVFDSVATGLADPAAFGLTQSRDLAYDKTRSGLSVLTWDPDGTNAQSWLFPFRADGAVVDTPVALPTQRDAGDKPTRCGSTHRADSPRVIVPFQAGTRHPILVTDSVEPMRLLMTNQAVMHGSPTEPCVAAFDAEVVALDPSLGAPEQERAILPMDDLEHAWLFRTTFGLGGEQTVEYRLMSCHFDPTLEPPPEVYGQPGTRLRRTR